MTKIAYLCGINSLEMWSLLTGRKNLLVCRHLWKERNLNSLWCMAGDVLESPH